jgi:hypothetical protein
MKRSGLEKPVNLLIGCGDGFPLGAVHVRVGARYLHAPAGCRIEFL